MTSSVVKHNEQLALSLIIVKLKKLFLFTTQLVDPLPFYCDSVAVIMIYTKHLCKTKSKNKLILVLESIVLPQLITGIPVTLSETPCRLRPHYCMIFTTVSESSDRLKIFFSEISNHRLT